MTRERSTPGDEDMSAIKADMERGMIERAESSSPNATSRSHEAGRPLRPTPITNAAEERCEKAVKLFMEMPAEQRHVHLAELIGDIAHELLTECRNIERDLAERTDSLVETAAHASKLMDERDRLTVAPSATTSALKTGIYATNNKKQFEAMDLSPSDKSRQQDTPRTDALLKTANDSDVFVELARQLERELAETSRVTVKLIEEKELRDIAIAISATMAATSIEGMRNELAAIAVAVGRSKDGTGFDVDWHELHKDVEPRQQKPSWEIPCTDDTAGR